MDGHDVEADEWSGFQGSPGNRGFPGADGLPGPKVQYILDILSPLISLLLYTIVMIQTKRATYIYSSM